ncbi:MAG TPA: TIGR03663 family protein, partial [bacterium]|nr:TIGR03663 family protein [bacterium]
MKEQPSKPIQWTHVGLMICGIFAVGAFLRLYQLSEMAYHHDESLHAYYSYKLFHDGRSEYHYDPVYHGPFLYHYTALIYALFGDSDFTGRLPEVTFGLLMLVLILRLRPWIGTPGVICTLIAVALSPTLTYFSRFARNDIFIATMTLGIVVFAMDYIRTKQPLHLVGSLFFLGLMYCCKENSLITGFILCSYLVFFGVYFVLSRPKEARKIALRAVFADCAPLTKSLVIYGLFSFFAFFYSKVIISRINWSDVTGDMNL